MKRQVLVITLAAAVFFLGFRVSTGERTLREAAEAPGMLIGTAVRPAQLSEPAYASTLAREFDMLEPEDALSGRWCIRRPSLSIFRKATRFWISRCVTE
jgi:hypothetical protein